MFADNLKKIRMANNVTQKKLAFDIGVSPSTIGMYEQGRRDPDTATILTIAEYFSVTPDDLLGELDSDLSKKDFDEIDGVIDVMQSVLLKQDGLQFDGEPINKESAELILRAMRIGMEKALHSNKKYGRKNN